MQFVKTALSSVWTRERQRWSFVCKYRVFKKGLAPSLQLIDTLHLSSCCRGPLAGSAELPKTHNFKSANTVFIHLTSKTRPHVSNLWVLMSPPPLFFPTLLSLPPSLPIPPSLFPSLFLSPPPPLSPGSRVEPSLIWTDRSGNGPFFPRHQPPPRAERPPKPELTPPWHPSWSYKRGPAPGPPSSLHPFPRLCREERGAASAGLYPPSPSP